MGWLKRSIERTKLWVRHIKMQSKLNLNEDDVPLNSSSWITKQWDDGTGNLNKHQSKLGGKENFKLGYRYKKLD